MRRLAFSLLLLMGSVALADGPIDPFAVRVSPEFRGAYQARGLIVEDRPVFILPAFLDLDAAPFGRFSVWSRTLSSLTDRKAVQKCEELYERDWGLKWRYDWAFSDSLALRTEIDKVWLLFHSYRAPARGTRDHTLNEWRLRQELRNPVLTPFHYIRRGIEPTDTFYIQTGVFRAFELVPDVMLTPQTYVEMGNARLLDYRFGPRTDGHGWSHGIQSLNFRLDLAWRLSSSVSLVAGLHQFITINEPARKAIKAKTSAWSRRDLLIWSFGARFTF